MVRPLLFFFFSFFGERNSAECYDIRKIRVPRLYTRQKKKKKKKKNCIIGLRSVTKYNARIKVCDK